MIVIVLAANVRTFLANVGAQAAYLRRKITAARHGASGEATNGGAIHVAADTIGHHFGVFFFQTSCGAGVTSFYTAGVSLV